MHYLVSAERSTDPRSGLRLISSWL